MTLRMTALATLLAATAAPSAWAQQCGGDFEAWKQVLAGEARQAGVGERGLAALENAQTSEAVLKRDRAQGVFTQTFAEFSSRMINEYRLTQGAANLAKYADVFDRAEHDFGVPGPVIAAFWALETDFGAVQGDFNTLNSLVTLAHDCRRPELFRPHVVPMLTLIDRGTLPADTKGAWAGEIGQTQILPADYLASGVDGDGDGKVDLRGSAPDAILTTANKISVARLEARRTLDSGGPNSGPASLGADRSPEQAAAFQVGRMGSDEPRRDPAQGQRAQRRPRASDGPQGACLPEL